MRITRAVDQEEYSNSIDLCDLLVQLSGLIFDDIYTQRNLKPTTWPSSQGLYVVMVYRNLDPKSWKTIYGVRF